MTAPARTTAGSDTAPVVAPLTVLISCALLVLMQFYVAIPLVPVLAEAFGRGQPAAAAALGTTYGLAYALGFLIFGPLSDRYGRKQILVPGMAVLAIATAGLAVAPSLPIVAVLRFVQGLVAASFAAAGLAYIGEALPRRWRATGIGAISTAFLSAGIIGQVYAQGVALRLGWRWVFGLAAPAFAVAAIAIAVVLLDIRHGQPESLGHRYRELGRLAIRRDLALPNAASFWVLLSFVAMYAALAPILRNQFGLDDAGVLLVRLAGLPAILLAPLAGWLVGRQGAPRVAVVGYLLAAVGLAAEAMSVGVLGALAVNGVAVFAGASCGPLVAQLPIGFPGLMLALAAMLVVGAVLVAISSRSTADVPV